MSWQTLVTLLALVSAGCFPMLSHGPRVENGLSVGGIGVVDLHSTLLTGDEATEFVPMLNGAVYVAFGVAPAGGHGAGWRFAASTTLLGPQVDFYAAAPAGRGVIPSTGAGLAYQPAFNAVLPYVMSGWIVRGGGQVYFTQGLGVVGERRNIIGVTGIGYERAPAWTFFATALLGHQDAWASDACFGRCRVPRLMVGISRSQRLGWPLR